MRIACLQFAPQVGDVSNNLSRADAVLSRANPQDLDLLVLPELAFTGYNFKSLQHITPFLEPTTAGITSLWARTTALRYGCVVTVGYPEKVDIAPKWPASPEYYNSAVTVNAAGATIANYRKSFLYYTDETWALEGPDGFYDGEIEGLGNVAIGICMDLNPYKFEAPWAAWEFAYHILHKQANLVILSMAWLTREDARSYSRSPKEPDMETLSYWLARLEPLIRAETEEEIIVVLCNRCGTEEEAVYAGTSAILGIQSGEVKVYGILGRGEKELLVVDTSQRPQAKLISEPKSPASHVSNETPPLTETSADSLATDGSKLSVDTMATDLTLPDDVPESMESIMTPLSPVDAGSPNAYFAPQGRKRDSIILGESLKSSIGQGDFQESSPSPSSHSRNASRTRTPAPQPLQDSPTSFRPPSTKSRNTSRTRTAPPQHMPDYYTSVRPPSPKSRNCSRAGTPVQRPALMAHDLAKEEQITDRVFGVISPPHSADAVLGQSVSAFAVDAFCPRRTPTPPRPKSACW